MAIVRLIRRTTLFASQQPYFADVDAERRKGVWGAAEATLWAMHRALTDVAQVKDAIILFFMYEDERLVLGLDCGGQRVGT
jgi:hypothetical protein